MAQVISRCLAICAVLAAALAMGQSRAEAQQLPAPAPVHSLIDGNGVDLTSGELNLTFPLLSIGPQGPGGLSFVMTYIDGVWSNNLTGQVVTTSTGVTVSIGAMSENFTLSNGVYQNAQGGGSTLTYDGVSTYTYTTAQDVVFKIQNYAAGSSAVWANNELLSEQFPTGEVLTFYNVQGGFTCTDGSSCTAYRLQSITSNIGYQLHLTYASDTISNSAVYYEITGATAFNQADDYCDPSATTCSFTSNNTWPAATIAYNCTAPSQLTDPVGRTVTIGYVGSCGGAIQTVAKSSGLTVTYASTPTNNVNQINSVTYSNANSPLPNGNPTWNYGYSTSNTDLTTTVTDPMSNVRIVVADSTTGLVQSDSTGPAGQERTTTYSYYPSSSLIKTITPPGGNGNYIQYAYDARGNANQITIYPKSSSSAAAISLSASYDQTCSSPVKCNKPNSITDANSHVTDYTYDPATGLLLEVQGPAPGTQGNRPTTVINYTQVTANTLNNSGQLTASGSVYRPSFTATCAQSAATASISGVATTLTCGNGASDEVLTQYDYSGSNNALPTTTKSGAGDGSLTATTVTGYDVMGNVSTIQSPLPSAPVTQMWYDNDRELVGAVGPDPDGSGPLLHRAVKMTYGADGVVLKVEQGTEAGYTNPTISGFNTLQQLTTTYDGLDRKVEDAASGGGTTYHVAQYAYDNANRLTCTAVRMNPSAFTSSNACAPGTAGSFGNDRITYTSYDAFNDVHQVMTGYGTSDARTVETYAYNPDGTIHRVADANNNVSTYAYDDFGRLASLTYPDGSSESYTKYDLNGNLQTLVQRNGSTINFGYDNLNRLSSRAPQNLATVTYAYDNLGRLTSAATSSGQTVSYTYDALGRQLTETEPLGTMTSAYDPAGNRTKLTWPDGFFVTYDYDELGEMTDAKESGSTVLASFGYDNLGERTSVSRYNNVSTSYVYDGVSELKSLTHSGSSSDQGFTYAYNPAAQMVSRKTTNGAYAWTPSNLSQAYQPNNANQYSSVGGNPFSNVGGNLASTASEVYGYDSLNRLTSASGSPAATLSYDPTDRLSQTAASSTTQFLYDGDQIVGEYNSSGSLLRRYVDGPGEDDPIVWYEGSGTSDRRWLLKDERGSVIAGTDASASVTFINSYDEYGQPGASNTGRFQYTGQAWIPEAAAYDYKARFYLPSIGRFLQADPTGYDAGMNLYAYAGADPLNVIDPTGLQQVPTITVLGYEACDESGCVLYSAGTTEVGSPPPEPNYPIVYVSGELLAEAVAKYHSARDLKRYAWRGAPVPQNDQFHAMANCAGAALGKNWQGLALDGAGWVANAALPEGSVAAAAVGSTLGVVGIGSAIASNDGPADATVAGSLAYVGKQASVAEALFQGGARASIALSHRIGFYALTASTIYDAAKTAVAYQSCMTHQGY